MKTNREIMAMLLGPEKWAEMERLLEAGPYPCPGEPGCSAEVELPDALCDACKAEQQRREQLEEQRRTERRLRWEAYSSTPEEYRLEPEQDAASIVRRVDGGARRIKAAMVAAEQLIEGKVIRATFQGPTASGKSTLASLVFRHACRTGPKPMIVGRPSAMWVDAVEAGCIRRDNALGEMPDGLEEILASPLVVLDDVGGEKGQDAHDVIAEIIHHRHKAGAPTIITTGFSREHLAVMFGSGITRRIFDRAVMLRWAPFDEEPRQ